MSSPDEAPQEITQAELDARLHAAREELLQHLAETSDLNALFGALMDAERAASEPKRGATHSEHAQGVISIRTLWLYLKRAHAEAEKLDRAFDLEAARNHGRTQVSKGALSQDLLEQNLKRARDRGVADMHARFRDLNHALVQDTCFTLEVLSPACERARTLVDVVERVRSRGRGVDRLLDQALDRAASMSQGLVNDLERARDHAETLNRLYPGEPWHSLRDSGAGIVRVDASEADLRSTEIVDLSVLHNFIWSNKTLWPPNISRDTLSQCSRKLKAGRYIVEGERRQQRVDVLH